MAKLVLGSCMSHSILLAIPVAQWVERAQAEMQNPRLNLSDGRYVSYDALLEERGPRYEDVTTPEDFVRFAAASEAALDRIGGTLKAAQLDVLLVVGDDHCELFSLANMPMISIYHGAKLETWDRFAKADDIPPFMHGAGPTFGMDVVTTGRGAPEFATALIEGLADRKIDVGSAAHIEDPHRAGLGHAFGFVMARILGGADIPIVPILLNTYYPPSVPTADRCYELGLAIREVIESYPEDLRIGIIGSGGLSHFVVDEELDRRVLSGFDPANADRLRTIPRAALQSGSSEILNWVVAAGAIGNLPEQWLEYYPVYRTPAGSGIGLAFGVWGASEEPRPSPS